MWLGEQMTERGIGNGMSLLIIAGIVAGLPDAGMQIWNAMTNESMQLITLLFLALVVYGDRIYRVH